MIADAAGAEAEVFDAIQALVGADGEEALPGSGLFREAAPRISAIVNTRSGAS